MVSQLTERHVKLLVVWFGPKIPDGQEVRWCPKQSSQSYLEMDWGNITPFTDSECLHHLHNNLAFEQTEEFISSLPLKIIGSTGQVVHLLTGPSRQPVWHATAANMQPSVMAAPLRFSWMVSLCGLCKTFLCNSSLWWSYNSGWRNNEY